MQSEPKIVWCETCGALCWEGGQEPSHTCPPRFECKKLGTDKWEASYQPTAAEAAYRFICRENLTTAFPLTMQSETLFVRDEAGTVKQFRVSPRIEINFDVEEET